MVAMNVDGSSRVSSEVTEDIGVGKKGWSTATTLHIKAQSDLEDTMNDAEGQDEERRRLLANVDGTDVEERPSTSPSSKPAQRTLLASLFAVALLLLSGIVYFTTHTPTARPGTNDLLSNGTHEFKRTIILVSIDGLRWDACSCWSTAHDLMHHIERTTLIEG